MRILIAALLLASLPAVADPAKPVTTDAKQMHDDDCAKARAAKRDCVLEMGTEQVDGHGVVPNGFASTVLRFPHHSSLIRIREDFIEQVLKTAQDL
jgi:hypothetical protein